jgi:hypothetical protein
MWKSEPKSIPRVAEEMKVHGLLICTLYTCTTHTHSSTIPFITPFSWNLQWIENIYINLKVNFVAFTRAHLHLAMQQLSPPLEGQLSHLPSQPTDKNTNMRPNSHISFWSWSKIVFWIGAHFLKQSNPMQMQAEKKKKKQQQQLLKIGNWVPPHQEAVKALELKESGEICPSHLSVDLGHEEWVGIKVSENLQ